MFIKVPASPPFFYNNTNNYIIIKIKYLLELKIKLKNYNNINMALYPLLNDVPLLFYYLCDLIVYEQFFRNDLLTDCLSDSELLQQWRKN